MNMKTINPLDQPTVAPTVAETAAAKETAAPVRPNALDSTDRCPVDGKPMQRMNAGVRGQNELPVYACLDHRVCLPVPNSELR